MDTAMDTGIKATHRTVLLEEAVDALKVRPDSIIVDATGGGGGHSARILELLGEQGMLVIIDSDPRVSEVLAKRFAGMKTKVHVVRGNFRNIEQILRDLSISSIDGVLADLGWNSAQFEQSVKGEGRGFSFQTDEPLKMTYGPAEEYHFDAGDIVNGWSEEVIADVLYAYADERYSRRIAKHIVEVREKHPILTTHALVVAIKDSVPARYRNGRLHPATKSFQALRIAVNDELDATKDFILASSKVVKKGGRIVVISFHSIEDRVVKHTFREMADGELGTVLTKKPLLPSREEVEENPRARSAKLRILEIS